MSKPLIARWVDLDVYHAILDSSKATGAGLTLLLVMARHLNAQRECWASVRVLATDCRVTERAIKDTRSKLVKEGELIPIRSGGGSHSDTSGYRIAVAPVQVSSPVKETAPVQEASPVQKTSPVKKPALTSEDLRMEPVQKSAPPSIRKLIKGENLKAAASASPTPPPPKPGPEAAEADASPAKKIFKIWTEEHDDLQPCVKLTPAISEMAGALCRAHPPELLFFEHFRLSVRIGSRLPFLLGSGGKKWRADLVWFLKQVPGKQHSFLRVLEGEFDELRADHGSVHLSARTAGYRVAAEHYCPVCRETRDCSGCGSASWIARCDRCRVRVLELLDPENVPLTEVWKLTQGEIRLRIDPQLALEFWEGARLQDVKDGIVTLLTPAEYREERHGSLELVRECFRSAGVTARELVLMKQRWR